jgi:acetyl-CoA acyltransferase
MVDIYVIGVGMTRFGRHPQQSVKDLTGEALTQALQDAGCTGSDIDAAFFANAGQGAIEGQYMISGQLALRSFGIDEVPISNVENACASASTAFHLACNQLRAGDAEVALAIGAEKMYTPDKAKNFAVFNGAWDVHGVDATAENLRMLSGQAEGKGIDKVGDYSIFMDIYASLAKQHMRLFGTTERQIAGVASKNHGHSTHNPLSQYRKAMSVEEVLAARCVAWPLTVPMCAPISDGAAAAILCRNEALSRFGRARAVRVHACVLAAGSTRTVDEVEKHICHRAAKIAYERAGLSPKDMSLAEVHDASAIGEIIQSENLGFCAFGEGGSLAERGITTLGGRLPINPSGGLESKGHPIGATGLGQIYELVTQLRGEAGSRQVPGARFAIAENGGGFHGFEEAAACVTILGCDGTADLRRARA